MKPDDRRRVIAEFLSTHGDAGFDQLARRLGVSEMTIRRDCADLERAGVGRRVRGGIALRLSPATEPPLALRTTVAADAKRRIALRAAELVADGDSIALDIGTTTHQLALRLAGRQRLTVVTPSIPIAASLDGHPGLRVLVTGGQLRHGELSLTGDFADEMLRRVNVDIAFIGAAGVDGRRGITDYSYEDSHIKRAAMAAAARVVVLADADKLGTVEFSTVCGLDRVDDLVTDAAPDHPQLAAIRQAGVNVLRAADDIGEKVSDSSSDAATEVGA